MASALSATSVEATKECLICRKTNNDPIEYGEFMEHKDIRVHYYCLLLSTELPQRGSDSSGILGFLAVDIKKEIEKAAERVCIYCQERHASVACAVCKEYFHQICGLESDCVFEFADNFASYCHKHHKIKHPNGHIPRAGCFICHERMGSYNPVTSITPKCCKVDGWVHRRCLKKFALSAGYYLKCILCGNSQFRNDVRIMGIFVPDRDASWEQKNAYRDFYKNNATCNATVCKCRRGRKYSAGKSWKIHVCNSCGASGVHGKCATKRIQDKFVCNICNKVLNVLSNTLTYTGTQDITMYLSKSQDINESVENIDVERDYSVCRDDDSICSSISGLSLKKPSPAKEVSLPQKELYLVFDESKKNLLGVVRGHRKNPNNNSDYLKADEVIALPEDVGTVQQGSKERGLKLLNGIINKVVQQIILDRKNREGEVVEVSDSETELSASGLIDKMCQEPKKPSHSKKIAWNNESTTDVDINMHETSKYTGKDKEGIAKKIKVGEPDPSKNIKGAIPKTKKKGAPSNVPQKGMVTDIDVSVLQSQGAELQFLGERTDLESSTNTQSGRSFLMNYYFNRMDPDPLDRGD